MSKKKFDTSNISNELTAGSVFFEKHPERTEFRTEERTENRSEIRSVRLPIKRPTKRYSFEFYEDQIAEIKRIKIETELKGQNISMSQIVRESFDRFLGSIQKEKRTENRSEFRAEQRTEYRTEERTEK